MVAAEWEEAAEIRQRLRNIAGEIEMLPDSGAVGAFGVVVPHGGDPERLAELTAEESELRASLPPARLWAFEAGLGKTTAAIELIAREAARGMNVIVSVCHHGLAEQCRADLAKAGCSATVIKGIDQPGMCGRTAARQEVQRAGLSPWKALCTERRRMPNGAYKQVPKCPRAVSGTCPFYDMRMKSAQVQIVTHSHLATSRAVAFPDGGESPGILVIDESFLGALIPSRDKDWSFDDLRNPPAPHAWNDAELVRTDDIPDRVRDFWIGFADAQPSTEGRSMHERLPAALEIPGVQAALEYHGDQVAALTQLPSLGYEIDAISHVTRQVGALLKDHRSRIALLLAAKEGTSGRVWVRNGRLHVALMKSIRSSWLGAETSVLLLDATPPPVWAVDRILGRDVVPTVIDVEWSRDIDVVQIKGAPNRKRDSEKESGAVHQLARALGMGVDGALYVPRASAAGLEMPPGMSAHSPGKLIGLNDFKDSPLVVVAANGDAGVTAVERIVGIVTGQLPHAVPCPEQKNGGWAHPYIAHGDFPDSNCRDIWQWMVEGPIVQSAARMRPIRRAGNPGRIVIFSDEELPIPVGRVVPWTDVDLGHGAEWLLDGKGCFSAYDAQHRYLGWAPASIASMRNSYYEGGARAAVSCLASGSHPLLQRVGVVRYRVPGKHERQFVWLGVLDPEAIVRQVAPDAEIFEARPIPAEQSLRRYSLKDIDSKETPTKMAPAGIKMSMDQALSAMTSEGFICLGEADLVERFGVTRADARRLAKLAAPDGWRAFVCRRAGSKGRPVAAYATNLMAAQKALARYGERYVVTAV